METVKYLKTTSNYVKILPTRYIVVTDIGDLCGIDNYSISREEREGDIEITADEFNEVFKGVHRRLNDLLLDVDCEKMTPEIANLVRQYDHNYMYIESMSQLKKQEAKNSEIKFKLKELGVKRFDHITLV